MNKCKFVYATGDSCASGYPLVKDYCYEHTCGYKDCKQSKAPWSCWCTHHLATHPVCHFEGCGQYLLGNIGCIVHDLGYPPDPKVQRK